MPAAAWAQASITGVVRDSSGAVLPGVTVEASSDVLIEKARTAVTDGTGTYRIVDLRAGTYAVTFSLAGFNTFKRDGIELTGTFTASINADLKVGNLAETITVSGESPIVDTQSVRQQTTIANDLIAAMPAARSTAGVMMLIPATQVQANPTNLDVQVTPGVVFFGGAGGRSNEGRIQVDGLTTTAALNGGGASSYVPDIGNAQEITLSSSGGMGEMQAGGPVISIIPKTGGNSVKGSFYLSNVTDWMVGDNYTQELKDRGLTTPGKLYKLWDYNLGVGGPIKKDRIWFFFQFRDEGSHRTVPGMFANQNMGDATKWTYVPDTSRPAVQAGSWRNAALRVTVQPTRAKQVQRLLGPPDPLPGRRVSGHRGRMPPVGGGRDHLRRAPIHEPVMLRDVGARGRHVPDRLRPAGAAGDMDLARQRPAAARSGLRHLPQSVGRHRAARRPADQPRAHDRAVHRRPAPTTAISRT